MISSIPVALLAISVLAAAAGDDREAFFEEKIRPVLVESCHSCHGGDKVKSGLRLTRRANLVMGGENGPAIIPGSPERSLLVKAIRREHADFKMPPKKTLPRRVVSDFETWIREGAVWPEGTSLKSAPSVGRHWAFLPLSKIAPPPGEGHPIDRFLRVEQERLNLTPVSRLDRRRLVRRAVYDLVGLPPSPEQLSAFLEMDTFDRVVDALLASLHYGERWGRHWLDLVRYADTAGDDSDYPIPEAYRYRDYVIDAFNDDIPYDRFLEEQLAGDILARRDPKERRVERIIATGFIALNKRFGTRKHEDMYLMIEDTIDNLGKVVLGMTAGCARCHDHKYEPMTSRDYYALYGFFKSTVYPHPGSEETHAPSDLIPLYPGKRPDHAYAVKDGKGVDAKFQKGGNPRAEGKPVRRGVPAYLDKTLLEIPEGTSGRLELAHWLTGRASHLAARVMVNRIWQHHFGKGLVSTPSDFGLRGDSPSHPELLDWLAGEFIRRKWSVKAMHRLVMGSEAYQRSSAHDGANVARDSGNRAYWRFDRRRLDAEAIRDTLLALGGSLDLERPGPHPFPPSKQWKYSAHRQFKAVYPSNHRSVYLMVQRLHPHPYLSLFNGADTTVSTAVRDRSTVPLQALFIMNSAFVQEQAKGFARRVMDVSGDDGERTRAAYLLAFGREPSKGEQDRWKAYRKEYASVVRREEGPEPELTTWTSIARILMTSNEMIYVD